MFRVLLSVVVVTVVVSGGLVANRLFGPAVPDRQIASAGSSDEQIASADAPAREASAQRAEAATVAESQVSMSVVEVPTFRVEAKMGPPAPKQAERVSAATSEGTVPSDAPATERASDAEPRQSTAAASPPVAEPEATESRNDFPATAYVDPTSSAERFPSVTTDVATVTANSLNLREAPDIGAKRIASLPQRTTLEIVERGDAWVKVRHAETGQSGWVHGDYLEYGATAAADR